LILLDGFSSINLLTEDVQEFRLQLTSAIEKQFETISDLSDEEKQVQDELKKFWNKFGKLSIFETRTCNDCRNVKTSEDIFTEFTLHISDNVDTTLEDLIRTKFSTGELDDEFSLCPICNENKAHLRERIIKEHPDILCIYLHRKNYNKRSREYTVYNGKVDFPITELKPNGYSVGGHETYNLISGIFHTPHPQENSGHYTAVCKKDNETSHHWIEYDDHICTFDQFISKTTKRSKVKFQRGAYFLFYERNTINIPSDNDPNQNIFNNINNDILEGERVLNDEIDLSGDISTGEVSKLIRYRNFIEKRKYGLIKNIISSNDSTSQSISDEISEHFSDINGNVDVCLDDISTREVSRIHIFLDLSKNEIITFTTSISHVPILPTDLT